MNEQKVNEQNIENELQEKLMAYRSLENRLNSLANQQNIFASKIMEIQSTIESINEIKKQEKEANSAKDILFPLGSAAHVRGLVADKDKIIVEVGAGVALEKTADEAKEILEKRKKEIEDAMTVLQKDLQSISAAMQEIESYAQDLYAKAQKEGKSQARQEEAKFGVI